MLINKRPLLVLFLLACLMTGALMFYVRVDSLRRLELHLQLTLLPYTEESFNALMQSEEFVRANGYNILSYCDYDQDSNYNGDPDYLATFRRRQHHEGYSHVESSPLVLNVYGRTNIHQTPANSTAQTNIVVFVTIGEKTSPGIENRIEQFDISSTVSYIDTFCMQFSRKTFGGYSYFIAG